MYKSKKHIVIRLFLLALFLGYFADTTFFTHIHSVNGTTVVHSHFFKGAFQKNASSKIPAGHTHTSTAFALIAHCAAWTATLDKPVFLPAPFRTSAPNVIKEETSGQIEQIFNRFYLRAPPAFSLFS